jgi:uncharacterized delta-60 repeat protein
MRGTFIVLAVWLVAMLAPSGADAALNPGQLDTAFGAGGFVDFDPSLAAPKSAFVNDVTVDAQGRTLATGGASDANGHAAFFAERFLSNGAVDTSFGENGSGFVLRQLSPNSSPDSIYSSGTTIDQAPDGGYLIGASRLIGAVTRLAAVKLTSTGHLEVGYGSDGNGTASIPTTSSFILSSHASVVLPNGSLVLTAAENTGANNFREALMTFAPNGIDNTSIYLHLGDAGGASLPTSIALLPSGKYLVGGSAGRSSGDTDGFVVRINPDGSADSTYGGDSTGASYLQFGTATSARSTNVNALANGPDSSVYALSTANTATHNVTKATVTRLGASGQPDGGFGPGGTRVLSLQQCASGNYCGTNGGDLLVDSSKRVLALVNVLDGDAPGKFAVARFGSDGGLDSGFGTEGVSVLPAATSYGNAMAFAPDNRLVIGGGRDTPTSVGLLTRLALERVEDPPPPASGGGSNPPAGNPPVVDKTPPKLTKLKITASTKTRKATLALTSSEAGKLAIKITRARSGHRKTSKSNCSTKTKTGRRCTLYVSYRSLTATLLAGKHSIALGRSAFALGSYRAVVTATDKAGNKAKAITVSFTVKAAPKPKKKKKK